jgi:hypothetical protein
MALNRGARRVNLPISGDVARYGREGVGESPLTAFGNIGKDIIQEIQNTQVKDFEIKQTSHKFLMDNIKAQKAKDKAIEKAGQEADAARAQAQFNNAVANAKSKINIDIDNVLTQTELNYKNPADFISNLESWVIGYTKDNNLQTFKNSKGEIIFDPKQHIIERVSSKSNAIYKKLYNDQVDKNAKNSLSTFTREFESSLGLAFSNISKSVDDLNAENFDKFLENIPLIFSPVMQDYNRYVKNLENLQETYPNKYGNNVSPDFLFEQTKKYRELMTEQTLGQVAKIYLDGSSFQSLEKSKFDAVNFIQDWYNNKFSNDSDLLSERLVHKFTTDAKDFDIDTKEAIVKKAKEVLDQRYQTLSTDLSLENGRNKSQITFQRNLVKKNILDVNVGPADKEYVKNLFTNYSKGIASLDWESINTIYHQDAVKQNLVLDFQKLFDPNESKDFLSIRSDPQYKSIYSEQELVDSLYRKLNQDEINVEEIISKVNQAQSEGFDISGDQSLSAITIGLEITNEYPTSFVDYANNLMKENFTNRSSQDKLYNFLSILKHMNNFEDYNLDSEFIEAAKYAFKFVNKTNVNETDVINMAESFATFKGKSKNTMEELQTTMIDFGNTFMPEYLSTADDGFLNTMKQYILPFGDMQGILPFGDNNYIDEGTKISLDIGDVGEESTIIQSVKPNIFNKRGAAFKDAIQANQSLFTTMVSMEATRLAAERDINYIGNSPSVVEAREQLFITSTKNVLRELSKDGWSFDSFIYNQDDPQGEYPVLSPYSILKHGDIKNVDDLKIETNLQLRMIFNAMTPAEKISFFDTENYQEEYIDRLDEMFDNGQIKFKVDDRSILSGDLRWFIMMDKEGQLKHWEELEVYNPNNEKVSWSPKNSVDPSSRASQKYVKADMKQKIVNDLLNKFSPEYRETGTAPWFDNKAYGLIAELSILTMDNAKEFTDKFSKFKDFDTIKEIANNNQAQYAVEKMKVKNKIEVPNEDYVVNEFAARIQQFDLPMSPKKDNQYFAYDSNYTDNNLNKKNFMAIGPNLPIDDPNVREILLDNNYSKEDILKMTVGEIGIDRNTYEQLGVYKYKTATSAYEEIYDEVILTPRQRNVLIDIIASVGVDLVGPESDIYRYIQNGNMPMVYTEIQRMKPYYNNTKRHTAHLRNWGLGG